jgi:hypothetical protein
LTRAAGLRQLGEGFEPPAFGTTTRIARSCHPSCLSWRAGDLRFLRTLGDRW